MVEVGRKGTDVFVQGGVAIVVGIIFFAVLFMPWLSLGQSAISGLTRAENRSDLIIPMTMILLALLTIFGGIIHVAGYEIGIQLATLTSATALFISVMVIAVTLANSNEFQGKTFSLLIGPWVGAAGAIFGLISSKLERK